MDQQQNYNEGQSVKDTVKSAEHKDNTLAVAIIIAGLLISAAFYFTSGKASNETSGKTSNATANVQKAANTPVTQTPAASTNQQSTGCGV